MVSRLFYVWSNGLDHYALSVPKFRKTFGNAMVTFAGVQDGSHSVAAATKYLSLCFISVKCPLQFSFYRMLCLHALAHTQGTETYTAEKDWWAVKLGFYIQDNGLSPRLLDILIFLTTSHLTWRNTPGYSEADASLSLAAAELQKEASDVAVLVDHIDAVINAGCQEQDVVEVVRSFHELLPPV